jgi:hypothetical protein
MLMAAIISEEANRNNYDAKRCVVAKLRLRKTPWTPLQVEFS